ncbi:MAG: hypothetical protein GEU28_11250 [Dehalococcoidia bacterium]|nr:hypothetical protein [Dehalococcoidia bacterium]
MKLSNFLKLAGKARESIDESTVDKVIQKVKGMDPSTVDKVASKAGRVVGKKRADALASKAHEMLTEEKIDGLAGKAKGVVGRKGEGQPDRRPTPD